MEQRLAPETAEETDPRLTKWARRAITIPGAFVLFALDVVLLPLLIAASILVDVARRRPLVAARFQLALVITLGLHVLGLLLLGGAWLVRSPRLDARIEASLSRAAWRAATAIYGMRMAVEGAGALARGPLVLMSRHVSLLDVLLPPVLASFARVSPSFRYVIKRELVWDPCVDILAHRLPNVFVRRGLRNASHEHEIARVASLAIGLGPSDALVIYPEGTRFTPEKRERILGELARSSPAAFARAKELRHLLPPHPGGCLAVLDAAPNVDVVFCAHAGLEGASRFVDLARGALVGAAVRVHLWRVPAAAIPETPDARLAWLEGWWRVIDDWIARS